MTDKKETVAIEGSIKKEQPKKVEKEPSLANVKDFSINEFIDQAIFLKCLSNDDISKLAKVDPMPKTILDIMNNIDRNTEYAIIKEVFNKTYWYDTILDGEFTIPIIIKELFITDHNVVKWSKITNANILNVLSSTFIPFDIHGDTLSILMRTPELPKGFKEKIDPVLSCKWLKKVKIVITSTQLFDYYKWILSLNEISDEI